VHFIIAEGLTIEPILGLEFLVTHHGKVYFSRNTLTLPRSVEIPQLPLPTTKLEGPVPVLLVDILHILSSFE
jgi:hypothetical protein